MRWNKPNLRNNLQGLLGRDKPSSTAWVRDQGLEEVRRAMLHSLKGLTGCEVARMNMRLRYAADIEALWYLRSDLLDTLTLLRGEDGPLPLLHLPPMGSEGLFLSIGIGTGHQLGLIERRGAAFHCRSLHPEEDR